MSADLNPDTAVEQQNETSFRFMLLCHQRSGSNALGAILNDNPHIWVYGQLFNHFRDYRRRNKKRGFLPYKAHSEAIRHFGMKPPLRSRLELAYLSLLPKTRSLDEMMDTFWANYRADENLRARGYKLHDYQVSDDDLAALATDHADGVVMLSRSNLLKAAVSWGYAIHTDVWSRREGGDKPQPVFRLDPSEIEWFIHKTASEVENWRKVLKANGVNFIELNYEKDILTRDLEPLYNFLGVDFPGRPEFKTKKLSSSTYSHIENAKELDKLLGNSDTGYLLE